MASSVKNQSLDELAMIRRILRDPTLQFHREAGIAVKDDDQLADRRRHPRHVLSCQLRLWDACLLPRLRPQSKTQSEGESGAQSRLPAKSRQCAIELRTVHNVLMCQSKIPET